MLLYEGYFGFDFLLLSLRLFDHMLCILLLFLLLLLSTTISKKGTNAEETFAFFGNSRKFEPAENRICEYSRKFIPAKLSFFNVYAI